MEMRGLFNPILALVLAYQWTLAFSTLAGTINTFAGVQSSVGSFGGDGDNNRIRKIDGSGIITTYFGTGRLDITGDGGAATSAGGLTFAVAGDTAGSVYVADNYHDVVRVIDPSKIVTTYAGGGNSNSENLKATSYSFGSPTSCAVDTAGNMFVSDYAAYKVKKITKTSKMVTTFAGTGSLDYSYPSGVAATSVGFNNPYGSFVSTTNMFYSAEYAGVAIRRVDANTGLVSQFAGGLLNGVSYAGDGGAATSAALSGLYGSVAGDTSGNIFVGTRYKNNIRVIGSNGIINRFAGSTDGVYGFTGDGGAATAGLLHGPWLMFFCGSTLYIPEQGNNKVRTVNVGGTLSPSTTRIPSVRPSVAPSLARGTTATPSRANVDPTVLPTVSPSSGTDSGGDGSSSGSGGSNKKGGPDVTGAVIGVLIAVGFIGLGLRCIYCYPTERDQGGNVEMV